MGDTLARNMTWFRDTPAYIADGRVLSHGQLYARAARLASALAAHGVRRQGRVSLLGRNSIEFGEVLAAGQLSGIIVATVNFRLAGPEIASIVADAGPRVLIADAEYLPLIAEHRSRLASVDLVVGIGVPSGASVFGADVVGYEDFLAAAPSGDPPYLASPDDVALLIYTSGTTGRPKGCILGQRETRLAGQTMNVEMRAGSDGRTLLVMPLFHVGAMFIGLGAHFRGGTAVLQRQFDPAAALDAIVADRVTVLHLAPTMLQALVDEAAARPDALVGVETVVYSAAPITSRTLAQAMRAMPGAGFLNLYGQTEVVSTGLPREMHVAADDECSRRRLRSVGMPFPGNEVRITSEDGVERLPGEPGEVCVRSAAMFRGYWNDHAATASVIRDGWCRTGDIGVVDPDGLLHLVDRKKDVIISGGENIYSLEVEECLIGHPSVGQVAVIGVPDDTWGEAVSAVVVPAKDTVVVPADLQEHVRSALARYKAPRHVFVTDQLPILPTGKVDKKLLRARYATADPAVS